MSHVNRGIGSATCQSCRKRVQSGRVGTVRRHKLLSGRYCSGGGCLSMEEAAEEAAYRADADRRLVPSGCAWCGIPERVHGRQWTAAAGWHGYVLPDARKIKDRMLIRRAAIEAMPRHSADELVAAGGA